ncbi:hypothetical protein FZI95_01640 [Mycobacterium sp. CBMA247]|nr:hypothetical protein [Mycolicibacterium sp. CBMA 329]MUL86260.1 hypothetical protein [Mycolicibacterium sp. CBMA 331]MUM01078.1 hypothetical protein [Mycolicibacterium sp. CBMA 334]MUM24972.1 hypothetical protein [Mycolicibacterium sp. CBMA 295]MUM36556.1 hypothetical protein [Mycolicibacterium sp. CBMA 247]MUM42324.1 hypothetical protein [Mycolicibacterium sp. CBMA 294]
MWSAGRRRRGAVRRDGRRRSRRRRDRRRGGGRCSDERGGGRDGPRRCGRLHERGDGRCRTRCRCRGGVGDGAGVPWLRRGRQQRGRLGVVGHGDRLGGFGVLLLPAACREQRRGADEGEPNRDRRQAPMPCAHSQLLSQSVSISLRPRSQVDTSSAVPNSPLDSSFGAAGLQIGCPAGAIG